MAARSSHTPAHAAPVQPLPWVCRRPPVGCSLCHQSLRSFSLRSCQPQPQTLPLRSRAGWSARLRWGGGAVSVGLKDAPSSPRSSSGRGVGFLVVPTSTVLSTRHEQPCPCTVAVRPRRKLLRAIRHRAASPQYVPLHVPGARKAGHPHIERNPSRYPRRARSTPGSRFAFVPVMESCLPTPARPPLLRRCGRAKK